MQFIKSFFGKNLTELLYKDIADFFKIEQVESDRIEFKSFSLKYGNLNKNLAGVIRGICAFLNSEGGVLIWGAPKGKKISGRKEKAFVGDLSPVNELCEKDWLISKISDSITPLPIGINVQTLEDKGLFVYVFEIQQNNYRPHQYSNIYYARLDGLTKPAPHYLIDALFKQIKYPNIEGFIKPTKISHNGKKYLLDIEIFIINFSYFQNEEHVVFRLFCEKGKFIGNRGYGLEHNYSLGGKVYQPDPIDLLHFGAPKMSG